MDLHFYFLQLIITCKFSSSSYTQRKGLDISLGTKILRHLRHCLIQNRQFMLQNSHLRTGICFFRMVRLFPEITYPPPLVKCLKLGKMYLLVGFMEKG